VPAGFKVEVYADGIPEARSLALGDKGRCSSATAT
jgi:hypothetical protein